MALVLLANLPAWGWQSRIEPVWDNEATATHSNCEHCSLLERVLVPRRTNLLHAIVTRAYELDFYGTGQYRGLDLPPTSRPVQGVKGSWSYWRSKDRARYIVWTTFNDTPDRVSTQDNPDFILCLASEVLPSSFSGHPVRTLQHSYGNVGLYREAVHD